MLIKLEIEEMLHSLENEYKKCNDELRNMPAGNLIATSRNGCPVFFHALGSKETYRRTSINNDEVLKRSLARKKYLEMQLAHLKEDIAVLQNVHKRISGSNPADILRMLPRAYTMLPTEYFFPDQSDWENESYPMSDYKPEMRRHLTSRGLKVRSKSELIIAEKYYENAVQFRYEQILFYGTTKLVPDFTIRAPGGHIIYWEHCGMTNDENYISHHKWKMSIYEKMDIVPWKNLIVTYDDENGNVNIPLIESEIKNKILKL